MKKRNLFPQSLLFTLGAVISTKILFATDAPSPPPLPPAPPSLHGTTAGAPRACPDTLNKTKLGQLVRNGIKAGVIKQTEGYAEDDVLAAMMTNKAPVKAETAIKRPKQAAPTGQENMGGVVAEIQEAEAQGITVLELRKRKRAQNPSSRQSAPARLENKPGTQADSAQDQPQKPEPAWMTKLKQKKAAAAKAAAENPTD